MKKLAILFIGLIVALSLTGLCFAQAKPEAAKPEAAKPEAAKPEAVKPEAAKAEEKKPEVKKEAPPKPVMYRMGGIVVAVDLKANKLTVQQNAVKKQRKITLTVSKKAAKNLADLRAGDAVNVWVTGSQITELNKIF
jgi:hypothetical protein